MSVQKSSYIKSLIQQYLREAGCKLFTQEFQEGELGYYCNAGSGAIATMSAKFIDEGEWDGMSFDVVHQVNVVIEDFPITDTILVSVPIEMMNASKRVEELIQDQTFVYVKETLIPYCIAKLQERAFGNEEAQISEEN